MKRRLLNVILTWILVVVDSSSLQQVLLTLIENLCRRGGIVKDARLAASPDTEEHGRGDDVTTWDVQICSSGLRLDKLHPSRARRTP